MRKSLLIAAMFGMSVAASAQQTFTHITIKSGFNQDVICEDKDRITETTTQSDAPDLQGIDGSGFAFFTTGVQTNGAMCGDDGLFKSSRTGATFKVMPTQLNALVLKGTKKTTFRRPQCSHLRCFYQQRCCGQRHRRGGGPLGCRCLLHP